MKIFITALILLTSTFIPIVSAAYQKPAALPVVTLFNTAGEQVSTEGIGKDKGLILLLVRKGNPGGDKLLSLLEKAGKPFPADRLLVVVGGGDEKMLKAISERHSKLVATWYRDDEDLLAIGLKLKGSPVLLGIGDGMVAWNIAGTNDLELLEKTMRGWLNR